MTQQQIISMNADDVAQFSEPIQKEIWRTRQAITRFTVNDDERATSLARFEQDLLEVADLAADGDLPSGPIVICRAYQHVYRA